MDLAKLLGQIKTNLPEGAEAGLTDAIAQLETGIQAYAGLDPVKAKAAMTALENRTAIDAQLQQVTTERDQALATAQAQAEAAQTAQKQLFAVRGLVTAGVRPEYEDLLLPNVLTGLQVADDGQISTPENYWDGLKQKYPAMFHADDAAGTGTSAGEGESSPAASPVQVRGGIISGVDPAAVLSGGVLVG